MNKDRYFENIATYKSLAKHEVGQNFLIDSSISEKIVDALEATPKDSVLEIGPGAGSLSFFLADKDINATLVDIDEGLIAKLENDFERHPNVKPIVGNALKHDMSPYTEILGNLPYYITSSLVKRVLLSAEQARRAVFMVQHEAMNRMFAQKGTDDYGPLSILLEYRGRKTSSFKVSRTCFAPMPHVDSSVFVYEFTNHNLAEGKRLYELASDLFLHRRKTILNNLTGRLKDSKAAEEILKKANVNPKARPESLGTAEYLSILHAMEDK